MMREPASKSPSIWASRPNPLACLRTYCIGSISRSAIQAAKGMPAVSPPATASMVSNPTSRTIAEAAKSISVWRTRGNEISRRQSI